MKSEKVTVSGSKYNPDPNAEKETVEAEIEIPIYETLDEAVQAESADQVLKLFNVQNKTTRMNVKRQALVGRPSKEWVREQAMKRITAEQWAAAAGDLGKIQKLMEDAMSAVEAELATKRAAEAAAASPGAPQPA